MKNLTFSWGVGGPYSYISISAINDIHMKTSCFKFHHNRKINEEFDFMKGRGRGSEGSLFINFNYCWQTYENVLF